MSQRWRGVGDRVSDLTNPSVAPPVPEMNALLFVQLAGKTPERIAYYSVTACALPRLLCQGSSKLYCYLLAFDILHFNTAQFLPL